MDGLRAWGGELARLVIACAVALLVLAPAIDAAFCTESLVAEASPSAQPLQIIKSAADSQGGQAAQGKVVGVCSYGNCHHAAPLLPPIPSASPVLRAAPMVRHALVDAPVPAAHRHFELNRPPRA